MSSFEKKHKLPQKPTPSQADRIKLTEVSTQLTEIITNLPSYGTISYDSSTHYWYIKLPEEWQSATTMIVNSIYQIYHKTKWYKESEEFGEYWYNLVKTINNDQSTSTIIINSVTPPSVVGLHISLGVHDIKSHNLPNGLVVNKKVEFRIGDIISFKSIRPTPQNIPGQYTNEKNLRYYPTRWLFAEVTFIDFDFPTRYPPHISIACIAVLLNVDRVKIFQIEYDRLLADETNDSENKETEGNDNDILISIEESTTREETINTIQTSSIQDQIHLLTTQRLTKHKTKNNIKDRKYSNIFIICLIIIILVFGIIPFPIFDVLCFDINSSSSSSSASFINNNNENNLISATFPDILLNI